MTDLLIERETIVLVEEARQELLVEERARVEVVTEAKQGPRGVQGPPGPAGGATLVPIGSTPISGHSAVAVDAAGELVPADCTTAGHHGAVLGVIVNAYAAGADAEVKTGFPLEHSGWTWTPGPVFVGTAGQLTQTLPPGALFSQTVGHAVSATRVLIDLQPPITIA